MTIKRAANGRAIRKNIKNAKQRGEWAEAQFMARAAGYGMGVSKPWGDSSRYDFVVETEDGFLRVQVKSTICKEKNSYACTVHPNLGSRPYAKGELDFIAAYVIPEDIWYIIPAAKVVNGKMGLISLAPSIPGHKYERYMEAWDLMRAKRRR
ncbi:MAG TPA: group I intron-associated PD-(D/E)XK endonuclease [Terriglobales bacterium]|nr:group I intron-associated PD-(D/E)XK endonuclease [Terriglobales bacterium]